MQDYLAASHVKEHELDDLLLEHTSEERWREVVLIAIGLVPQKRSSRLLASFLEREGADASALEVAGLSLAEDVQVGDDLRDEVRRRLLERLEQEESPGAFGRLTGALLAADLDGAKEWMGNVLQGRDPQLRDRILQMIPSLGEEHGKSMVPLLLRLLEAKDETSRVRMRSALTLAESGVSPDAEDWEVLGRVRRDEDDEVKVAATWAWCELGRHEELGLGQVPAGEFLMGDDRGDNDEKPRHTLYLPTFYIGHHPVSPRSGELNEELRRTSELFEYSGTCGGGMRRSVEASDGSGFAFYADAFHREFIARLTFPDRLELVVPGNDTPESRFWREFLHLSGSVDVEQGHGTGSWTW